jgi:ribonuclease HI
MLKKVYIWTDGACEPNPGSGGWAAILRAENGVTREMWGGEVVTTNNRMEVTALIRALKKLREPCEVRWFTDSQYAISIVNHVVRGEYLRRKGIKVKKVKPNLDLVSEMYELLRLGQHRIISTWVKGHAGQVENERCDALAEFGRLEALEKQPEGSLV